MIKIYPFGNGVFFAVKDDTVIYSTHPDFKISDKKPDTFAFARYDYYLKDVENKNDKIIRKWLINYLKENQMCEHLI